MMLRAILRLFQIDELIFKKNKAPGALHPGISSCILKNGKSIGWVGQLHPKWKQHYEYSRRCIFI